MQQPAPACLPLLAGFPMANSKINYFVFNRLILTDSRQSLYACTVREITYWHADGVKKEPPMLGP
jgi:hypothetical protein